MVYDPYNRIMRPDFQSDDRLPQWVPMDDEQDSTPSFSPMMDALRNKIRGGNTKGTSILGTEGKAGGTSSALSGTKGGAGGGGMKSL